MKMLDDIRALGAGAPLRAGYELSKRTFGHDLVFGRLVPPRRSPRRVRVLENPSHLPDDVQRLTLDHADRICNGDIEVFGRNVHFADAPEWHSVLHAPGTWPPAPWWKIDIRSDARLGDIKWCWELGRFRHVVILARACFLVPNDQRYINTLRIHVTTFLDANPPEQGVHWYSNLELALRSFAWLQVISLADSALGPELLGRIVPTLHHTGRHLVADLPYTVSTMRNNHLLGDAVGLCTLGYAFADQRYGRRWTAIGDRLIRRFLRNACRPNGTFIEDSVSYHRFVVELLSARVVLGGASAEVRRVLHDSAEFLVRLGVLEGPVPQYGDWDEGRALTTSFDPCRLEGSVRAALALSGDGAPDEWRQHDEVAWYCPSGTSSVPDGRVADGQDIGGGISRAARGDFAVWLKAPAGTSHQHADATALSVTFRGGWVTGDPGTGTYNGPVVERNYFRSSLAHNVLRVNAVDQLEPHRAFRWKHSARGGFTEPVLVGDTVVLASWHDAYRRLEPATAVVRVVVVDPRFVAISDFIGHPLDGVLSIPLHADVRLEGSALSTPVGGLLFSAPGQITATTGTEQPFKGWWSDTYGERRPATLLETEVIAGATAAWAISTEDIEITGSDRAVAVPGLTTEITWLDGGAELTVRVDNGRSHTRSIRW